MPGEYEYINKNAGIIITRDGRKIGIGTNTPCCQAFIELAAGKVKIRKARSFRRNKNPKALIIDGSGNVGIGSSTPSVESDIG